MPRGPSRPYPPISVMEAAEIAQGIRNGNAGRPMNRILLAETLGKSPGSSDFRDALAASAKYGFTQGNYTSETIGLTGLGEQLTKLRGESEKLEALRQGLRKIPLFEQLLNHFNNNKLPAPELLKNILEKEPFNVRAEWSQEAAQLFEANGRGVGFIRDVTGSPYVLLGAGPPVGVPSEEVPVAKAKDIASPTEIEQRPGPKPTEEAPADSAGGMQLPAAMLQFFIAHGKDKEALGQLQNILKEWGIPFIVAEEEASAGRPISRKVKELMHSCSGGIFIFSADEQFKDLGGNNVFRPRENVIYELGAASYLYDQRIVIFKEKGVAFATDFRDLGYIEYERGQLAGKTMELLKELIALKAVKLLPGS